MRRVGAAHAPPAQTLWRRFYSQWLGHVLPSDVVVYAGAGPAAAAGIDTPQSSAAPGLLVAESVCVGHTWHAAAAAVVVYRSATRRQQQQLLGCPPARGH